MNELSRQLWATKTLELTHTKVPRRVIGADSTERTLWKYRLMSVTAGFCQLIAITRKFQLTSTDDGEEGSSDPYLSDCQLYTKRSHQLLISPAVASQLNTAETVGPT